MKLSRSEFITLRGLRYHIRQWGDDGAPKLFLMHGWMDVSASFQFMVDCLKRDWHVIAPDWRGFGLTDRSGADNYWFPDYLGDLDAILNHYAPEQQINLLGHSMGGNIVTLYAGVRPERIRRLINLEGFGMGASDPQKAPRRYARWLDELQQTPTMRSYASPEEVARRLQKTNPRLPDERAAFLAGHWSRQNAEGRWEILGDPIHKNDGPLQYQLEEVLACWRRIEAPMLWVEAEDTDAWHWLGNKEEAHAEIHRRLACVPRLRSEMMPDAGHMLHHDQPRRLAELVEDFLI